MSEEREQLAATVNQGCASVGGCLNDGCTLAFVVLIVVPLACAVLGALYAVWPAVLAVAAVAGAIWGIRRAVRARRRRDAAAP